MKVTKTAVVVSSKRGKTLKWARQDNVSIASEMVRPMGREYSIMLVVKRFLIRSVFFSRARMRPGKPIQAKLRRDISIGLNGYRSGRITKSMARIEA